MESSIAAQSISMPQDSKFTEGGENQSSTDRDPTRISSLTKGAHDQPMNSNMGNLNQIPEGNSLYQDSQEMLEGAQ